MPPDSRADGPCGPKARRTRGPASPGQRTAQPFGGTLNASPLRCAPGASVSRGRSAGTPRAAVHAGHRPPAGVPRPMQTAAHAGHRPPRGFRRHSAGRRTRGASVLAGVPRPMRAAVHAGPRPPRGHSAGLPQAAATRGASVLAGVPQASRRPPPQAGPRPSRAFRGPRRPPPRAGHRPSRPTPPSQAFPTPPAARARPHPPAARFSRKPPCGIGSRMVYCT